MTDQQEAAAMPIEVATGTTPVDKLWHYWRGSPELLAQVGRVAERSLLEEGKVDITCLVDVEVRGDHEVFSSPSDFTTSVTGEALKGFHTILITVKGGDTTVTLDLNRKRPWWKPGMSEDADVHLVVSGTDEAIVQRVFDSVAQAAKRGHTDMPYEMVMALMVLTVMALTFVGASSLLYLLGVSSDAAFWWAVGATVVSMAVAITWGTWIVLPLEVASTRDKHHIRAISFVIPIVATLAATGLAKAIYGG